MKQTLQLKISQSLTMTPQLQQAIRLLQLSGVELQEEIQQAVESNPMLEPQEDDGAERGNETTQEIREGAGPGNDNDSRDSDNPQELREASQDNMPDDLPVDSSWDDTFEPSYTLSGSGGSMDGDRDFEVQGHTTESLQEHLIWQMEVSPFTEKDALIATSIIDAIDDDGYLIQTIDDILQSLAPELETEEDEVIAVLHRIQNFDPPGIGARDLRESMLLQLAQLEGGNPRADLAIEIVGHHFESLANRDYAQIMRKMKIGEEELQQAFALIQSLNPRPGSVIASAPVEYIVPDVFVRKKEGKWLVELNPDVMPRLRINDMYANMIQRSNASSDNVYLKNQLQEARWFIKSLQSRSETLLKVATCIVERQQAFLEQGEEFMKPLVMSDIAEAVEMHESTISRVTTKKYMHTPQGIYELKFFFSSHVSTSSGGECSSTAIRAMIRKLIAAEEPNKPLSDSKIANILSDKGINVARRTVAKYREAMSIPPSNERKRLM